MDWKAWMGKKIFVQLKKGGVYSGKVIEVDNSFMTIIDKFGERVSYAILEIIKIKEENGEGNGRRDRN